MDFDSDLSEFELSLLELFIQRLVLDRVGMDTPIHKAKEIAADAGKKFGRSLAVMRQDGEISPDALMAIRAFENEWKARFVDTVERQLKPGGQVREMWNKNL